MHKFLLHTLPVILLCLSSYAQPNPINRRAMAIAGLVQGPIDIPSSIGLTISNRWMSTHFCSSQVISDWPDETNAFHWVIESGGAIPFNPVNSTSGVWFDQSTWLYATNTMTDQTLVCFMIIQAMDGNGISKNDVLFQDTASGLGAGAVFDPAGSAGLGRLTFDVPISIDNVVAKFPTNVVVSVIYTGSGTKLFYTNGVDSSAGSQIWHLISPSRIGANGNSTYDYGFRGYLKEFIVYKDTSINSSQISNLNYYAQNYPYTASSCAPSQNDGMLTNISSPFLWWHGSDAGSGPQANWVDRIQAVTAKQSGTHVPFASGSHFTFYATDNQSLTNVAKQAGTGTAGWAMLLVCSEFNTTGTQTILGDGNAAGDGIQFNNNGNTYWVNNAGGGTFSDIHISHVSGLLRDILICPTNGTTHMNVFTNGVSTGVDLNQSSATQFKLQSIGTDSGASQWFGGVVYDVFVWTNTSSMAFSAADVSNVHYWCTNVAKYQISP